MAVNIGRFNSTFSSPFSFRYWAAGDLEHLSFCFFSTHASPLSPFTHSRHVDPLRAATPKGTRRLVLILFVVSQTTVSPVSQTSEYFPSSRLLEGPGSRANALRFRQDLLAESVHDSRTTCPIHEPAHDLSPVRSDSSRQFDETRHDLFQKGHGHVGPILLPTVCTGRDAPGQASLWLRPTVPVASVFGKPDVADQLPAPICLWQ